ncbi:methyltransferase domain protein [Segatella baroniae F0067]|uniref:Methyltransferase domain protein n=1 Tax=Segatella baroniae F0067 TaxID=1115809 RepID=U2P5U9_9BACT|nr:class I SAM-dependent methyltransferase [Segatella baroniae]ERK39089.1 methyltransferase domain protein [Segatella baroniae F0067]
MEMTQKNSYSRLMNRYDDVMTGRKWWSWLYMHCLWKTDDNAVAREVLEMIPDNFSGTMLDVPVGTAVFTCDKYRQMTNAEITGVDYSREMLDIARSRFDKARIKHVALWQGDVGDLPFPSEHFDLVLSMNGFHVFPEKERAFAEVFRVLNPGGTFCGCFYIKGERRPADWFVRKVLDKRGLFIPPHYTRRQAEDKLRSLFEANVEIRNERSILIFKCVKPDADR